MPRKEGLKVYNTFVGGLVTEATPLTFPENAAKDALNCVFDKKGDIRRRLGIDYEASFALTTEDVSESTWREKAVGCFEWAEVGGDGDLHFLVVQVGPTLHFYDMSTEPISNNKKSFTVDLTSFSAPAATDVGSELVDVSYGKGYLFVVSKKIKPFYIKYDSGGDTITNTEIGLRIRDFDGLDDSLDIDEEPSTLSDEHNYNLKNQGWVSPGGSVANPITTYFSSQSKYPGNNKQWWVAKDASDNFSPTELTKIFFGNTRAPRGHYIIDPFSKDRATASGIGGLTTESTDTRPQATSFFAGRAWYGGPPAETSSGHIFFSQIIEAEANIGNCYQEADPTSEEVSDLIDTDGGVIVIPEAGNILSMSVTGESLLVFANNGVWEITGSAGSGFTPTDYSVSLVSKVGIIGKRTIVNVEGTPVWWSDKGVFSIGRNQVTDRIEAQSLSEQTIQTYYEDDIPDSSKVYAQGSYDPITKRVTWGWNSDGNETNYRFKFDRALVFDTNIGGFYPWSFSELASNSPYVFGIYTLPRIGRALETTTVIQESSGDTVIRASDGEVVVADVEVLRSTQSSTMFIVAEPNGTDSEWTFAQLNDQDFLDWTSSDSTGVTYSSYFETGYLLEGNVTNRRQAPHVFVYTKQTSPDSSCYMQPRWDFSDDEVSSKFGREQQVYRNSTTGIPVVVSRLKVRGSGRALTLRFRSETGKDFDVYGWAVHFADNARA